MSEEDIHKALRALYDVVEVNNIGAVPTQVAVETLKMINPAISFEQATAIIHDADSRGKELLTRQDLSNAVLTCLQNTESDDALRILRDHTVRMRVAFRRRYLMYDAPANSPPAAITTNAKAMGTWRQIFDTICSWEGKSDIDRNTLRQFVNIVLSDFKMDANNICKAALGDPDTDRVAFLEFVMVAQPATSRRALSDLCAILQRHQQQQQQLYGASAVVAPRTPSKSVGGMTDVSSVSASSPADLHHAAMNSSFQTATQQQQRVASPSTTQVGGGATPTAASPALSNTLLRKEVEHYKMEEHVAQRKFAEAIGVRPHLPSVPSLPEAQTAGNYFGGDNMPMMMRTGASELTDREVAELRIENGNLKHQLAQLQLASTGTAAALTQDRSVIERQNEMLKQSTFELANRVEVLEKELRLAHAHLGVSHEAADLTSQLKQSLNPQSTMRNFFPDEATLTTKHKHVTEISHALHDGVSPVSTVLAQYEMIVAGYQSLYRTLRGKYDTLKRPKFDAAAAAASIVPQSPVRTRNTRITRSPSKLNVTPMRWSELDAPPSADMRGTGTLADPLLTDTERNQLRAKLATQMRSGSRHYSPAASRSRNSPTPPSSRVSAIMQQNPYFSISSVSRAASTSPPPRNVPLASHDALRELQAIAGKAARERRL